MARVKTAARRDARGLTLALTNSVKGHQIGRPLGVGAELPINLAGRRYAELAPVGRKWKTALSASRSCKTFRSDAQPQGPAHTLVDRPHRSASRTWCKRPRRRDTIYDALASASRNHLHTGESIKWIEELDSAFPARHQGRCRVDTFTGEQPTQKLVNSAFLGVCKSVLARLSITIRAHSRNHRVFQFSHMRCAERCGERQIDSRPG